MAAIDVEKFADHLRKRARNHSQGICAKRVREALEAGGGNTKGHPHVAKAWAGTLIRMGFRELVVDDPANFIFLKGDIVVIQPYLSGNTAGHIAGYDGKQWISDFKQHDFWSGPGYRSNKPRYVFYRP